MTATAADPTEQPRPGEVMRDIVGTAVGLAASSLSRKVDGLSDRLEGGADAPEVPGAKENATMQAAGAGLAGKNPVWAAVKGAWSAGGVKVKAAVIAAIVGLVLLLVLFPVLVLLLALTIAVVLLVAKIKQRRH